jgi:hypothetical protein
MLLQNTGMYLTNYMLNIPDLNMHCCKSEIPEKSSTFKCFQNVIIFTSFQLVSSKQRTNQSVQVASNDIYAYYNFFSSNWDNLATLLTYLLGGRTKHVGEAIHINLFEHK